MPNAFQSLTAAAVPLPLDNIDTDQIIPARFLKGTEKTGLGLNAFYDWRYHPDGRTNESFVLNQAAYLNHPILVARHNFGCGSSREHAPWALVDFGFRVILAVSFADIFKNNAMKNGLLPVELPESTIQRLLDSIAAEPQTHIGVDLPTQTVTLPWAETVAFAINPFWKKCLLEGVDQIGYTLARLDAIEAFERQHWVCQLATNQPV